MFESECVKNAGRSQSTFRRQRWSQRDQPMWCWHCGCDDVSVCSTTQRSVLDSSGKSGAVFLNKPWHIWNIYLLSDVPDSLWLNVPLPWASWRINLKNVAQVFLPQSRSRAYGSFKKMSSCSQAARESVLKQVDERLDLACCCWTGGLLDLDSLKWFLDMSLCIQLFLTEDLEVCASMWVQRSWTFGCSCWKSDDRCEGDGADVRRSGQKN